MAEGSADPRSDPEGEDGPRLAPLAAGEWDPVLTRVLEGAPGGTTEPMNIFTTLGKAPPELFRRWLGFGGALLSGTLPGRLRELVILRTAFRFGGGYEWAHHVELAEAQGVTRDEIAALGRDDGPGPMAWIPVESAALAAVDETADQRGRHGRHVGSAGGVAQRQRAHRAPHVDRPLPDAHGRAGLAPRPARAVGGGDRSQRGGRAGGVGSEITVTKRP